jgi:hypothetical protein
MTWLDLLTVVLVVLVAALEAKRGAVPAAAELAVGLMGLGVAKTLAGGMGTGAVPFLVLFAVAVGLAALTGWLVDTYTKWDIGAYDGVAGAVIGVVTGCALAHGVFHAAVQAGGNVKTVAQASLLYGQVYELQTIHAIGDMLRNLGGGPTIVDEVRKQQK